MVRIPGYCLHKPSGRAVVNCKAMFGDKPHYLPGEYGSPESRLAYEAIRSQIVAGQLLSAPPASAVPTISFVPGAPVSLNEVFARFLFFAELHYQRKEFLSYRSAMRVASGLCGTSSAASFGPVAIKSVRDAMIALNWSRNHINHQVNRLRLIVKWAVEEELVDQAVYFAIKAVSPLRQGKSEARETAAVAPVSWEVASAVLPFVAPIVAAMVHVQYLTGMRSDELTSMRPRDLARGGDVWVYQPASHKTQWRGKRKFICIGPEAQRHIAPYLPADDSQFVFSPAVAIAQHNAARAAARKTKRYGKSAAAQHRPRTRLQPRYTAHSYLEAIQNGFRKMAKRPDERRAHEPAGTSLAKWLAERGIAYWHPHQLRHTRGTLTRSAYGIEGAQAQLGNALEATEIYAEKSLGLAVRIASETG